MPYYMEQNVGSPY